MIIWRIMIMMETIKCDKMAKTGMKNTTIMMKILITLTKLTIMTLMNFIVNFDEYECEQQFSR